MIRVNFAGASLVDPGSYTDVQIAQSGAAAPALGIVALIGESEEGPAFATETGLSAVSYGPDEFQAIVEKFGSGELVDAAKIAISPSNDPQIRGGAQELVLLKTNNSTTASLSIPQGSTAFGTLTAKRSGVPGNNVAYQCSVIGSQVVITLSRLDTGVKEVSAPLGNTAVLTLQCTDSTATTATAVITSTQLITSVAGSTVAQSLVLDLKRFPTVKQLVDFLNSQPGYSASVPTAALGARPTAELDNTPSHDIKVAYTIKKDFAEVASFFAKSALVKFTPTPGASGLPTTKAKTYLAGGTKGATSPAAIQSCIDALLKRRVNFIVPLFSRDAAADVADGLTDSSSNYSIAAIHQGVAAHCNQAATIKGRKERQGFVGFKDTFLNSVEASAQLSAARVQLQIQDIDVLSASTGLIALKQPHMLAVISAAMKASAPVGLPNTFKQPQLTGFAHADFDPETMSEKAIEANISFVEKAPTGGFRFKIDNSTYSLVDGTEWANNRPSVLYAADTAAYSIRLSTERFIGQRNSDVSEETVKNQMVTVMDSLKTAGIIVATAANPKGYKDLTVKINGSIVNIGVTLILVEGIEFVLSSIKVQRAG